MIDIKRVLAPTDFSATRKTPFALPAPLAERFGAELHLVHVLSEIIPAGPDPLLMPVMPPQFYQENENRAKETLRTADPAFLGQDRPSSSRRCGGEARSRPSSTTAQEHQIDMIVIATHGRTGLSHVLLGSVAERIVREAICPVLTIRDSPRVAPASGRGA